MSLRVVVALFHRLQDLLFAQRDFVVLKTRREQNIAQNAKALIQILREQVQAHAALRAADVGAESRRQKRQPFLQLVRGIRARAAAREQITRETRETLPCLRGSR